MSEPRLKILKLVGVAAVVTVLIVLAMELSEYFARQIGCCGL